MQLHAIIWIERKQGTNYVYWWECACGSHSDNEKIMRSKLPVMKELKLHLLSHQKTQEFHIAQISTNAMQITERTEIEDELNKDLSELRLEAEKAKAEEARKNSVLGAELERALQVAQ